MFKLFIIYKALRALLSSSIMSMIMVMKVVLVVVKM